MVLTALTFFPAHATAGELPYPLFAVLLVVNGIGMGMFTPPNRAEVMSSRPATPHGPRPDP
jgi:hypothetical protein